MKKLYSFSDRTRNRLRTALLCTAALFAGTYGVLAQSYAVSGNVVGSRGGGKSASPL